MLELEAGVDQDVGQHALPVVEQRLGELRARGGASGPKLGTGRNVGRCSTRPSVLVNTSLVTGAGRGEVDRARRTSCSSRKRMAPTSSARLIQLIHCWPEPSLPRIPKRQSRASRSQRAAVGGRARCRCGCAAPGCRPPRPARRPPPTPTTTSARNPVPGRAGLGELLVATVAVDADGRAGHEHRRLGGRATASASASRRGALRAALEDLPLLVVGPALLGDALTGEVHHAVEPLEAGGVDVAALDVPTHRAGRRRPPRTTRTTVVPVGLERARPARRRSARSTR